MSHSLHLDAPLVSVVIAAHNAEPYLAETLRSVTAQTFTAFEAIVIDDGSTDRTGAIAEAIARTDARVRVVHQPMSGPSSARNTGLAYARGELIALLDSDDLWTPDYLAAQVRAIDELSPTVDIVSANAWNLGGPFDGALWKTVAPAFHPVSLLALIANETSVCILSVFRRRVVERIGGFDVTLRRSEDYDYWLRAAAAGFRIVFNGTPLGYYRRRADSASADEGQMLAAIQQPLRKLSAAVPGESAEASAIALQLKRFERERLLHDAKRALVAGDWPRAQEHLRSVHAHTGTMKDRAVALLADRAPSLLAWAYSWRRTTRARRASGEKRRPVTA